MSDAVKGVADELLACAASFVQEHRLPGAAVGVVVGDELSWSAGVGLCDVASARRPASSTLFRIASITKTFTGTAIMQLCVAGKVRLDDPVVTYLPELHHAESNFGPIETLTIRRMLSHESGLASDPSGTDWTIPRYEGSASANLARAHEIATKIPPNVQTKYSNLAYQLLGEVVARVSDRSYAQYVQEMILDPLGLTSTAFEPLSDDLLARHATGYAARGYTDELSPAETVGPVWAEGGLWSSVEDLARWLSFQLRAHRGEGDATEVLPDELLRTMHKPRYLNDDGWTWAFGITWYGIRRDDGIWIQHSGGLPGFVANVCFDPKGQVGAIALLNGVGPAPSLAMDLAAIASRAVKAKVPELSPPTPTPEAYRSLLGLYSSPASDELIRLEWRDGKLTLVAPEFPAWRPTLKAADDPDVFVVAPGVRESGERVVFSRRPDGHVASMLYASASYARLAPVEHLG